MSVSYSTGGSAVKKKRTPKILGKDEAAEHHRLLHLPAYMRAILNYPEEFKDERVADGSMPWADFKGPKHEVWVKKGHSPKTHDPYWYLVIIYLEEKVTPPSSRFFPVAIFREDDRPKRWINQMGSGTIDPPADGRIMVWSITTKARSERMNSIISKAKAQLSSHLKHERNSKTLTKLV